MRLKRISVDFETFKNLIKVDKEKGWTFNGKLYEKEILFYRGQCITLATSFCLSLTRLNSLPWPQSQRDWASIGLHQFCMWSFSKAFVKSPLRSMLFTFFVPIGCCPSFLEPSWHHLFIGLWYLIFHEKKNNWWGFASWLVIIYLSSSEVIFGESW